MADAHADQVDRGLLYGMMGIGWGRIGPGLPVAQGNPALHAMALASSWPCTLLAPTFP